MTDEDKVLAAYRQVVKAEFGDLAISVHHGRLVKCWRTTKDDLGSSMLREIETGG